MIQQEKTLLAKWMTEHSRTAVWLAVETHVSYQTAWNWVRGLKHPNLTNALKLRRLTGLSLEQLTEQ